MVDDRLDPERADRTLGRSADSVDSPSPEDVVLVGHDASGPIAIRPGSGAQVGEWLVLMARFDLRASVVAVDV
jgi:hypothetical protein